MDLAKLKASLYPESVNADIRSGRLIHALRRVSGTRRQDARLRLIQAELLQQTGECVESIEIIERELKRDLEETDRALAYEIFGAAQLSRGNTPVAKDAYKQAIDIADGVGDVGLRSRCRLRVLPIVNETGEALEPLVSETRRLVIQSHDPHLLAWYHVRLGQVEGKRGALVLARKHFNAGRSLLNSFPNLVLSAYVDVGLSSVSFLDADLSGASEFAEAALEDSLRSGHAAIRLAAIANLALANISLGNLSQAEQSIERGLELAKDYPQEYLSLINSTLQLRLAQSDRESSSRLIEQINARWNPRQKTWSNLSRFQTRIKYLLRFGDPAEALPFAEDGLTAARARGDRLMSAQFLMLQAEALLALERGTEAATVLADAGPLLQHAPLTTVAEFERIRAKVLADRRDEEIAIIHFDRAARILQSVENRTALRELADDYVQAFPDRTRTDIEPQNGATTTRHHLEAAARTSAERAPSARGVDGAAALLAVASRPDLLGCEALALLASVGAACSARVIVRPQGRPAHTILSEGGVVADEAWEHASVRRAALGQTATGACELEVLPRDGFGARSAATAICRLAEAAATLEAAARDARNRASLWPVDEMPDASRGVFIAPAMQEVLESIRRVARTDLPVLLIGETGTGKEVVSREIHRLSSRASGPFVPFNCTAVSRDLLESQLFGYRRGAFTGAQEDFRGVIRGAEGGTLFLDEIGELGPELQPKLLRFLESREIHPLGEESPVTVSVRVIAATNAVLGDLLKEGKFRQDLFYRLNVWKIEIPPLRERQEEIPALVNHFARIFCEEIGKPVPRLSDEAVQYLLLYSWPGNVRQLVNEVRRIVALLSPGDDIVPGMLAPEILSGRRALSADPIAPNEIRLRVDQPLPRAIDQLERAMIDHALKHTRGSLERAAQGLGISRRGLFIKRRRLGLDR
jgi:DNA-binding NtrC family response regulator